MSEAWQVASIESCEQIPASPTMDLVRVSATSSVAPTPEEDRPVLVLDDGYTVTRIAAMPAPPDDDGWLRCAFAVPDGLATLETAYGLELDGGLLIALPHPGPAVAPATVAEPPVDDVPQTPEDSRPLGPEDLGRWAPDVDPVTPGDPAAPGLDLPLLLVAAEARAELRAMRELRDLRAVPGPAVSAGARGGDPHARAAELEVWSGELERRLAEATDELDVLRAAMARDAAELRELRVELAVRERAAASAPRGLDASERDAIGQAALAAAHRQARSELAEHGT